MTSSWLRGRSSKADCLPSSPTLSARAARCYSQRASRVTLAASDLTGWRAVVVSQLPPLARIHAADSRRRASSDQHPTSHDAPAQRTGSETSTHLPVPELLL